MSTTMATFAGVPASRRWVCLALRSGLKRIATTEGMQSTSRDGLRPPLMKDLPFQQMAGSAAVVGKACAACGLLSVELPDLGQEGEDHRRRDRADAGDGAQDFAETCHGIVLGDKLGNLSVQVRDLALDEDQPFRELTLHQSVDLDVAALGQQGPLGDQGAARNLQLLENLQFRRHGRIGFEGQGRAMRART